MIYEFEGKTEKEAIEKASEELGLKKDQFDVEILDSQKSSFFKKGYVKIRVHTDDSAGKENQYEETKKEVVQEKIEPDSEYESKLVEFITTVIRKMGYEATVEIMYKDSKKLGLRLVSDSSSILIGRKGKNLDALQLLANVYVGRLGHEDIRVILDSENYRIRREESLVRLAYSTADRVRMSKGSILLEPMNPFERRLIHTTLNDINDVDTKSEGEGLYKQVRVFYKGLR